MRGGPRKGAGRKSAPYKTKTISIRVKEKQYEFFKSLFNSWNIDFDDECQNDKTKTLMQILLSYRTTDISKLNFLERMKFDYVFATEIQTLLREQPSNIHLPTNKEFWDEWEQHKNINRQWIWLLSRASQNSC
jgi:hypothetical protein